VRQKQDRKKDYNYKVIVVNTKNKKGDDKQKIKLKELPIEQPHLNDYLK
jgi:hypothetical protein